MQTGNASRIASIDILRGAVMVIMALDHVRDYFYQGSFYNDPTNLTTTTAALFFTRFITNFCAPVFVFLAGTSACLYGSGKSRQSLSRFLLTRGLWLMFLEVVLNNFIWSFDIHYSLMVFQVIFTIGTGMVCLSLLIFLPQAAILMTGLLLVAGHNTLDGFVMEGKGPQALAWYFLHQSNQVAFGENSLVIFLYPVLPWIGLMALGYLFGQLYRKDFDEDRRNKWLLWLGIGAISSFFILRGINAYGDPAPWSVQDDSVKTVLSFFNVAKYPPSLLFSCMTLGPAFLLLRAMGGAENRIARFFRVYGSVPLFYYFMHMLIIHLLAMGGMMASGGEWRHMIITARSFMKGDLADYGYSLPVVYAVWMAVVMMLYPLCRKYMLYKQSHREKWWLSYL